MTGAISLTGPGIYTLTIEHQYLCMLELVTMTLRSPYIRYSNLGKSLVIFSYLQNPFKMGTPLIPPDYHGLLVTEFHSTCYSQFTSFSSTGMLKVL